MRSATRLVLGGLAPVGLAAGVLLGAELLDAPRSVLSAPAYAGVGGTHRWALLAVVAALPRLLASRWASPPRSAAEATPERRPANSAPRRSRISAALAMAAIPVGLLIAAVLPRHAELASLGFVFAAWGTATLLATRAVVAGDRRRAVRWAGSMLVCAGAMHASAAGLGAPSWWAELGQGWAIRAVLVGLPFAAALRHLDVSAPTQRLLAAALVVFTLCGGPLQPLRVMCAAVALKVWRQSSTSASPGLQAARTWLLGAASLLVVSECGAAVIGLDDPFAAFSYVPVAQMHYLAAAGFAAAAALHCLESVSAKPSPTPKSRTRVWARTFVLGAHLGCGALLLLGRAGMPRGYVAYFDALQPLFRVAAVGAAVTLLAAAAIAWSWARPPRDP